MNKNKTPSWSAWLRRGLLFGLITAAGMLLAWQSEETETLPASTPVPTIQKDERTVREAAYDKDVSALQKLLESGAADEATQRQAARHLDELIMAHQSEIAVEEALRSAGYDPVLVLINGGAMTVMMDALDEQNSAAVLSLCAAHGNVGADQIRLMAEEFIPWRLRALFQLPAFLFRAFLLRRSPSAGAGSAGCAAG